MGNKLTFALVLAMLAGMFFPMSSRAQRVVLKGEGAAMRGPSRLPFRAGHSGPILVGRRSRGRGRYRGRGYGYGYAAYPYLYPGYYYSDYYSEPAPSEPEPTRVVVIENSQPRPEAPPQPPPESLLLERQGNHWVRITDSGETSVQRQPKGSAKTASLRTMPPQESAAVETPRKLPPAVLVFRDGHKEEITRYTIVGGTLYTSSDYWNNGSWTKKVPLAQLDIPATLELNRERGARFSLPSSPSVVVVRP